MKLFLLGSINEKSVWMKVIKTNSGLIKAWVDGVSFEEEAKRQVERCSRMPFIFKHITVMPDVHLGKGATIGSVIPTKGAVIPAAVGVDIGCGMMAQRLNIRSEELPDNLSGMRSEIERSVPHGRTNQGKAGDRGAWNEPLKEVGSAWSKLYSSSSFQKVIQKHPKMYSGKRKPNDLTHLGTLGSGNHFIEVCLDESDTVWVILHSGSRGIGNRIGNYFIELAKEDMRKHFVNLPDKDLAYFSEGTQYFNDYMLAVEWAQLYAACNRNIMMDRTVKSIARLLNKKENDLKSDEPVINCHHNYVSIEDHFENRVLVTRKGALSAKKGEMGIIPGSMGSRSYIVRGKGNKESFHSCSHGAGRKMSRSKAKKSFTIEDHKFATKHVECRKDKDVIDETPRAYKDIDKVISAQSDLVDVVHTLTQVVCVKG